jgi:hypothetical protein
MWLRVMAFCESAILRKFNLGFGRVDTISGFTSDLFSGLEAGSGFVTIGASG